MNGGTDRPGRDARGGSDGAPGEGVGTVGAGPAARVGAAAGGRRLVVHVGTPKTGSTTIQRALAALDPALRERGVHVPVAARANPAIAQHLNLNRRFSGFRYAPQKGAWRALAEEIRASDARLFVLSDEGFTAAPHRPLLLAALAELAARCALAVDIVAYVRPQCQYLEARYAEQVKNGGVSASFEVHVAKAFARRPVARHPRFNYARAFGPWRAAFDNRVVVTPLEPSRLPDGLVAHFLGLLGAADLAGTAPDLRANPRIGAKELEVRRLTTVALRRAGGGDPRNAPARLRGLAGLLPADRPFTALSAARAQALMDRFAASNAAFARDYGISARGVLFADPPLDDLARPTVARWEDLTADERRAAREYVREAVGVDPAPRPRRGGGRPDRLSRAPGAGSASRLDRVRREAPVGSPGWRAAWLAAGVADGGALRRIGAALRRARAAAAAAPGLKAVFDTDRPGAP